MLKTTDTIKKEKEKKWIRNGSRMWTCDDGRYVYSVDFFDDKGNICGNTYYLYSPKKILEKVWWMK